MEDHIYEDPDESLPVNVPAIPAVILKDYRENFAGSSGRKGEAQSSKSLKNLSGKQKGKKKKDSKKSGKPKKEKCVRGGNEESGLKKSYSENRLKSKTAYLNEQNPKNSRSRGHSESAIPGLSPALLGSVATVTMVGEPNVAHEVANEDSPPPALPSRGYLLDEEFSVELKAIERRGAGTDTESDEESDGYTSMDNIACYDEIPSKMQEDKSLTPLRRYENFTSTNRQPIQDAATTSVSGRPHKNFDDAKRRLAYPLPEKLESHLLFPHPIKNIADTKSSPAHTAALPERGSARQYKNGERGHLTRIMPGAPPHQIADATKAEEDEDERLYENFGDEGTSEHIADTTKAEEDKDERLYENFGDEGTSEQKDPPPIPLRSYNNDARGHLTHTAESQSCLPPLPERSSTTIPKDEAQTRPTKQEQVPPLPERPSKNDKKGHLTRTGLGSQPCLPPLLERRSAAPQEDTPPIPGRPCKNDKRGRPTHRILEAECQLNLPPRRRNIYQHFFTEENQYGNVANEEGPPDVPQIPVRPYRHLNSTLPGAESDLPLVPEGEYTNFTDVGVQPSHTLITAPEDDHMPPIPPRCYENFTDAQDTVSRSQEEESESYVLHEAPEWNDSGRPGDDEDEYINQDDSPGYVNSGDVAEGGESEDPAYDYVHADAIRSIRGRAGRWAGRKGNNH